MDVHLFSNRHNIDVSLHLPGTPGLLQETTMAAQSTPYLLPPIADHDNHFRVAPVHRRGLGHCDRHVRYFQKSGFCSGRSEHSGEFGNPYVGVYVDRDRIQLDWILDAGRYLLRCLLLHW